MQTVPALATALAAAFVKSERTNGDTFYHLADDSPEWMTGAIHACHGEMMPDDWRYSMIRNVAYGLADTQAVDDPNELSDLSHEILDGLVSIYNADRLNWVSSNLSRAYYVNDAVDNLGGGGEFDLFEALGWGMYEEYREVWESLVEFLTEETERQNEDDEE